MTTMAWRAHEVFWGEQGMGVGGDVVEEKKQASERTSVRPYAWVFLCSLRTRGEADLGAFPFTPFTAIVLTARPKSQKARLRIGRIHELRFDDTLHGESWPAGRLTV